MAVLASGWVAFSLLHCEDKYVLVFRATTVGNVVPTRCATTGACRVQLLVRANAARVNELTVNYEGVLAGTGVASCSSRGIQPSLARIPLSHRPEPHVSGGAVSTALVRRQRNRPGFAAAKTPGVWGSIVGVSRPTLPPVRVARPSSRDKAVLFVSLLRRHRQASTSLVVARFRPAYHPCAVRLCVTAVAAVLVAPP